MKYKNDHEKRFSVKFWKAVIATTAVTAVSAYSQDIRVSCILVALEQLWLLAYLYSVCYPRICRGHHKYYFIACGIGGILGGVVARILLPMIDVMPMDMMSIMLAHGLTTVLVGRIVLIWSGIPNAL